MFSSRSRYATVADAIYQAPDGRQIPYKLLRVTPASTAVQAHTVAQGDRLDLIAFQYFSDPEQFWRICDANQALRPDDLTQQAGVRLVIPAVTR